MPAAPVEVIEPTAEEAANGWDAEGLTAYVAGVSVSDALASGVAAAARVRGV